MRRLAALVLAFLVIATQFDTAEAKDGEIGTIQPPVTIDDGSDTIGVDVGDGQSSTGSSPSGTTNRPKCTYTKAYFRDVPGLYEEVDNDHPVTVEVGGVTKTGYFKSCPGRGRVLVLIDDSVTVQDMIDEVSASIRRRIPQPVADINPAPENGGIVNLGLWLAVEDPGPISAHAAAGSVAATAFAHYTSTHFDFGNGDTLTCTGLGTPIEAVHPDLDTNEQGPCGYTYRASSPDASPYQLTISSIYTVTYTSTGGGGTLGTITTTRTYPYDVDEIQTIGTRG